MITQASIISSQCALVCDRSGVASRRLFSLLIFASTNAAALLPAAAQVACCSISFVIFGCRLYEACLGVQSAPFDSRSAALHRVVVTSHIGGIMAGPVRSVHRELLEVADGLFTVAD